MKDIMIMDLIMLNVNHVTTDAKLVTTERHVLLVLNLREQEIIVNAQTKNTMTEQ
jgi:hypothetical protein